MVNLGTAGSFAIISESGISATGSASVLGDVGVSPGQSSAITGFSLVPDNSHTYATSSLVSGKVYASDYSSPTPAKLTTAVNDMKAAYADAAGRTNLTASELGGGDMSGMVLTPGEYKWSTAVTIAKDENVNLNCQGNTNAVFIFQVGGDLTMGSGAIVNLSGGCQASHVFWQVAGQTTLGARSLFKGVLLDQGAVVIGNGATISGRVLAQAGVTIDTATVAAA